MKEVRVWKLTYATNDRMGVERHVYVVADSLAEISRRGCDLGKGDPTSVTLAHTVWVGDDE